MNGRLEVDQRIFVSVEEKIKTMPSFINEWYYNLRASEITATSCRDFITKVKKYMEFVNGGNQDISKLSLDCFSNENLTRYLTSIQTKTIIKDGVEIREKTSDSYRQCVWSCLNNLCEYLYTSGKIGTNYLRTIKRPKNNDLVRINDNRVLLTETDFNKILEAVDHNFKGQRCIQKKLKIRDKLILLLLITTGMRRTALSEINFDDIDFSNETVDVIDKREKHHTYKLSKKTMEALNEWLPLRNKLANDTNAVFITATGGRMNGNDVYKIVDKYCKEALGYHISPHKIRAGFCSVIYDKTKDIEFTRRTVGHSNIETTKRYIVTKNDEREKSSKIIDDLLNI